MSTVTLERGRIIILPPDVCSKYGLEEASHLDLVETDRGILLIPPCLESLPDDLRAELQGWQELHDEALMLIEEEPS